MSHIKVVVVHQLYQTVLMKPDESEIWFILLKDSVLIQNILFMHTRVETIESTYVVCKMIMCPDPYFWYHSINDYEYNNIKKSEAVLALSRRIRVLEENTT